MLLYVPVTVVLMQREDQPAVKDTSQSGDSITDLMAAASLGLISDVSERVRTSLTHLLGLMYYGRQQFAGSTGGWLDFLSFFKGKYVCTR